MKKVAMIMSAFVAFSLMSANVSASGVLGDGDEPVAELTEEEILYEDDEPAVITRDGVKYLIDTDGSYITGKIVIDDKTYFGDSKGRVKRNQWVDDGKDRYYVTDNGSALANGIYVNRGDLYIFSKEGVLQKGLVKFNGKYYYCDKDTGILQAGIIKVGSKKYYFDPKDYSMQSGWVIIDSDTYYFGNNGAMITGKVTINNVKYTFDYNGKLVE